MDSVSVSSSSFSRSNYKSMRAASAKGLINEPGSNNCFLNSAVQVLWHLDVFRRSFRLLSAHRCTRDSCIFCALKVVFTQFEYSDHAQIAPDQLRKALAACTSYLPSDDDQLSVASGQSSSAGSAGVAQFPLGSMADACECLENLLLRLHAHLDYSANRPPTSCNCTASHCITHSKFSMRVRETLECSNCGARNNLTDYVQLVYYVATHAILANVRTTSESYGVPDAFGRALRAAASAGEARDCSSCNQRSATLSRQLVCAPDVLSVGLVWNTASPSSGSLTTLYEAIGTSLRVGDLFDSAPTPASPGSVQSQPYQLVGVVCYVGRHYATFMFHSRTCTWILFDDSNVKEIGRSWHLVVARCLKCRFVPVLLLYANPNAPTIDASSVPQSIVQISNAELLRTIELLNGGSCVSPATGSSGNGSLSRGAATRHERSSSLTGSNAGASGNSLERSSRLHKKARPGGFQSRVRAVASVENLQLAKSKDEPFSDDAEFGFGPSATATRSTLRRFGRPQPQQQQLAVVRDSAAHRRQNSLVYALGISDEQSNGNGNQNQITPQVQVLRTGAMARNDSQTAVASRRYDEVNVNGTIKRYKSLENVVGGFSLYEDAARNGVDSVDLDAPYVAGGEFPPPPQQTAIYGQRIAAGRPFGYATTADESGDSSIESSVSSFAGRHGRGGNVHQPAWLAAAGGDSELNPRAIEALGFRQQFTDLLAKADALVRDAADCEAVANVSDALLKFTQASICLKQASDLPAIEQRSRLAAVSRQNACNASVKRLHRRLKELAVAAGDTPGVAHSLSAANAARQDSGVSTWSEADPSGHSTASEELFIAPQRSRAFTESRPNDSIQIMSLASSPDKTLRAPMSHDADGNTDDPQSAYTQTLTHLGPYATLPRKPKGKGQNGSCDPNADNEEPLYAPQAAITGHMSASSFTQPPSSAYSTLPNSSSMSAAAPAAQPQPVVFTVRSTRRAVREEIYATYTQLTQLGDQPPQQQPQQQQQQLNNQLNSGAYEQTIQPQQRVAAVAPPPKPNVAVIRQRLEQMQTRPNATPPGRVAQSPATGVSNWSQPQSAVYGAPQQQQQQQQQQQSQYATRPGAFGYPSQVNSANSSASAIANGNQYQLNAIANAGPIASANANANAAAANLRNAEPMYMYRSELTSVNQGQAQAVVARSANTNKLNQPFKTPQPVRRTAFMLDSAPPPVASSYSLPAPASYPEGLAGIAQGPPQPPPPQPPASQYITRAQLLATPTGSNTQSQPLPPRSLPQPAAAPAPGSPNRVVDIKPSAAKKKVTFLDDLIAKQAERVRQNMAQLAIQPPAAANGNSHSFAHPHPVQHQNASLRRTLLTANANANGNEELFSDSSLSSLNSNSTRQSIPIGNRFAYSCNAPFPAYAMSGHDADNETSSSIASSVDAPQAGGALSCELCHQRPAAFPNSYCSACAVYMSKLAPK